MRENAPRNGDQQVNSSDNAPDARAQSGIGSSENGFRSITVKIRVPPTAGLISQSDRLLGLIKTLINATPAPTRGGLFKEVCERLDLRDHKGDWQIGTCAKALRDLESQGILILPGAKHCTVGTRRWNPARLDKPVNLPTFVPTALEQLQGLRLLEVRDQEHLKIWNELMISEHPLHDSRLVGRQLRYLIGSEHGWLGGLGFGSAALYLEGRDRWIGWSDPQRIKHLERVINMNRFLIRPSVRCQNLASHVLSLCARQIVDDFERRYGLRPWLMESFVEQTTYTGACYQAANWIQVGVTKGRGRNGPRLAVKSIKDVYLYPLADDIKRQVGVQEVPLIGLSPESGMVGEGWAEHEFGGCELGDKRLGQRLVTIARQKAVKPGSSYGQASGGDRHSLKAYYRFTSSERTELNVESMLQTHRLQTLRRMKAQKTVLIIQDTTDLNFASRAACAGLGQIGTNQTATISRGLRMHSSLAITEKGLPLGVVRLGGYAPETAEGKDTDRPIQEKDSFRWLEAYKDAADLAAKIPDTQVISLADREADMFELFDFRRRQPEPNKADLLVRAKNDRCLEDTDRKLFAEMAAAPTDSTASIEVPRQREHASKPSKPGRPALPARKATVEIRYKEITISAPNSPQCRGKSPIRLWCITLTEKNPPAGATALNWTLLTTIQVASSKVALTCINWYCRRWRIEEWHRVMKSTCNILEHQNRNADGLLRAIAIDAVISWRIMLLTLLGREAPELACEVLFNPNECAVLETLSKKNDLRIGAAMIVIAKLGGYLNRRCDGPPGFQALSKGYIQFNAMVEYHELSAHRRNI